MLSTTLTKDYQDRPYEDVPCPLCEVSNDLVLARRGYPGIPLTNVICRTCGLIRINPRMTREGYEKFYQDDFFEYLNPFSRPAYIEEIEGTTDDTRDTTTKRLILPYILDYVKEGGRVLDVGAGFGQVIYLLAKNRGVTYVGLEPDPGSRAIAKEKMGIDDLLPITVEEFLKSDTSLFDFIYLEQVYEHILSPKEVLTALTARLAPEGVIYIGVPNAYDPQVPMALFYQLAHTYNYTPATLAHLAKVAGLKIISIRDPLGTPLEFLLARKESSYKAVSEELLAFGSDWRDVARRLRRKSRLNRIRSFAKQVFTSILGPNGKERLQVTLDRLFRYRY